MLTFTGSEEKQGSCIKLLGITTTSKSTNLITDNTSLLLPTSNIGCLDTCSFYNGPSDSTIMAFGESLETCGTIAYATGDESCGSIAYSGAGEACGSIASAAVSSGTSMGTGCSYSC